MTIQFNPPPEELVTIQKWFASIITSRMTTDHEIQELSPRGNYIAEEAKDYVIPSHTLLPHERMQIYNQSYWARLLDVLEEIFPLVARLFGSHDFQQMLTIPYLLKYPVDTWDLNAIGSYFPTWIKENYVATDKRLVLYSAEIDWACQESFFAKDLPPLDIHKMGQDELAGILQRKIRLQTNLHLFELPYNLLSYREAFLKEEVEYWIENDFPKLEKEKAPYFLIVYRNAQHTVEWKEISQSEFLLLQLIRDGKTLEEACLELESMGGTLYDLAKMRLAFWIQEWFRLKWFAA